MADYNLKNVEADFWKEVRIYAISREMTIKELILTSLKEKLDKNEE